MSQLDATLKEIDVRIAWIMAHPGISSWLKDALRDAIERGPIDVLNDLEILNHLLRARSHALIHSTLVAASDDDNPNYG